MVRVVFRNGALAVAAGVGRVATYAPDAIHLFESGLRFDHLLGDTQNGYVNISRANWHDIQADLVGANGFPYTANIGSGRVIGIEGNVDWTPQHRIHVGASGLVAFSALSHPARPFIHASGDPLPNTPKASASVRLSWAPPIDTTERLRLELSGRYVGPSHLGVGPILSLPQGNYASADLAVRVERRLGVV